MTSSEVQSGACCGICGAMWDRGEWSSGCPDCGLYGPWGVKWVADPGEPSATLRITFFGVLKMMLYRVRFVVPADVDMIGGTLTRGLAGALGLQWDKLEAVREVDLLVRLPWGVAAALQTDEGRKAAAAYFRNEVGADARVVSCVVESSEPR